MNLRNKCFNLTEQGDAFGLRDFQVLAALDLLVGGLTHLDKLDLVLPGVRSFPVQRRDHDVINARRNRNKRNVLRTIVAVRRVELGESLACR